MRFIAFLSFFLISQTSLLATKFTVQVWVKAEQASGQHPLILGNKLWDSSKVVDFTSNHNFGKSSESGLDHGWAFALQDNGAWAWNISDGERRLDYLPTADKQNICDGAWHHLVFTLSEKEATATLYFDGSLVAIYSLKELKKLNYIDLRRDSLVLGQEQVELDTFAIDGRRLGRLQVETVYRQKSGIRKNKNRTKGGSFKVLNWNIWHGGRKDGLDGLKKTIGIIRKSKADIVTMQETYGSGPIIADSLNMIYYYRSTNLGIFSKYPIIKTHDLYEPFHFGGVTLQLPGRKQLHVFSTWLNYLPDIDASLSAPWPIDSILQEEEKTRLKEINEILKSVDPLMKTTNEVPIIIAGDFNSPSHLDFIEETKARHKDLIIEWPVSKTITALGFKDAFRKIYPDPSKNYGETWSPRFPESSQERIDHIYFTPSRLECTSAKMLNQASPQWPSDHAAVLATFKVVNWKD